MMKSPNILEKLPAHLHPYVATQDPQLYTAMDQACWRYIMRVSKAFFAQNAHQKYLDGLAETGVGEEQIPLISEMDEKLRVFGWRAVPIIGFIPPAIFMEFLSLGVLPIACDMRTTEHLAYTPAPDIVHESAGHAPIIADPEYADYLHLYGEIAKKVIFSQHDEKVYLAIRKLSDTKEDPDASPAQVSNAQAELDQALGAVDFVSEATELARMSWWTIEYGLVGTLDNPKIYGAGLLSSVSESFHCLSPAVIKLPMSLDCIRQGYDITRPQPQLYVTPDFQTLSTLLEKYSESLAYRRGGRYGLEKALQAKTVTTTELETGVQVSGVLLEVVSDSELNPIYLKYQGPVQLAMKDHEIEGQGASYHREGYSFALGRVKDLDGSWVDPQSLTIKALESIQKSRVLEFESGVRVEGLLVNWIREGDINLLLQFQQARVFKGEQIYFQPDWGTYDLVCGTKISSVFGCAADRGAYFEATTGLEPLRKRPKTNLTPENRELNLLYERLREYREGLGQLASVENTHVLANIVDKVRNRFRDEWLIRLELLEFIGPWTHEIRQDLKRIAHDFKETRELIERGLALLPGIK
jgi:phenylalanine-4-hydroxylase